MFNKNKRIKITVTSLMALIALILGLFVSQHIYLNKTVNMSQFNGTLLDKPREVSAFALTGIDKSPFNNASLQGRWTFVFFGFTSCGTVCPTTMAELAKMYRLLEEKGTKILPQVVMVSVDPARDSLATLGHYVKAFHPNFYGVRGDEASINLMTKEMGIAYMKVALPGSNDLQHYDIEHTGTVMLFNPQGKLSGFFTTPHQASLLAQDYLLLVS